MAIFLLNSGYFQVTMGGALLLGDIGNVPRLQPPSPHSAEELRLGPVTGYIAVAAPATPIRINLDISVANTPVLAIKLITITPIPTGDMTIKYTVDGTLPTVITGLIYTVPFNVSGLAGGQVVLNAIAYPNQPLSENYVLTQSDLEIVTIVF